GGAKPTRRRAGRHRQSTWSGLLRGLLTAIGVTLGCVLIFALLMQWLKPSDTVIRVVNQLVKLLSIFAGTWVMLGRGGEKGMLYGALLGLVYMAIGVGLYALLSGQRLPLTAYLSDIAMGVAGGGIAGAIIGGMQKK
ncbi:MAG: TIGR04086 family membrane protein, partial [Clostridia bacterium]